MSAVTLLGPQRRPTLDTVLPTLQLDGQIATITAGWQEREPDDEELDDQLDTRGRNLALYARWLDVQEHDPEFAAADRRLRDVLDQVQEVYVLRLDHALQAVYAVQRRHVDDGVLTETIEAVRELDARHLDRIDAISAEFYDSWVPHERSVIAEHRAAVAELLADSAALVVAGGHVGVLTATMHLFNVGAVLGLPVIAWSAGAMALTDRIVLFHDRTPLGPGHPEIHGGGVGLLPGVVALPHASARLLLGDPGRMSVVARRFAPAACVLLDPGARVDADTETGCPPGTPVLADDGSTTAWEAA